MPKDYVPPQHGYDGFNCPNPACEAYSRQQWYFAIAGFVKRHPDPGNFRLWFPSISIAQCDKCNKPSIWVDGTLVFPESYGAPAPSPDMSGEIKNYYEEAQAIFSKSPRGAAALLRLAIQKLTVELGESGSNLDNDIGNLVKKGLPVRIQQALDGVRVIGNEAVHPGQIDINDNPEIALSLFTLVNLIIENMITRMKKVDELYKLLPDAKKEHIEERDANE
jgi:hypothetical protein